MLFHLFSFVLFRSVIRFHPSPPRQFRAVPPYADSDTFKNMVAAAHLKPINDPKKTDLASTSAHLFQADGSRIHPHDPTAHIARSALAGVDASALTSVPTSAPEFQRDWRRHPTAAEKVGFLR